MGIIFFTSWIFFILSRSPSKSRPLARSKPIFPNTRSMSVILFRYCCKGAMFTDSRRKATANQRAAICLASKSGFKSQVRNSRPPMAVLVSSIIPRSDPSRELSWRVAKSSKLRIALSSIIKQSAKLYCCSRLKCARGVFCVSFR